MTEGTTIDVPWQVWLYVAAVLIPLGAFTIELLLGRLLGRVNAYLATAAIGASFVLSVAGFLSYQHNAPEIWEEHHHHGEGLEVTEATATGGIPSDEAAAHVHADPYHVEDHGPLVWSGSFDWVLVGEGLIGSGEGLAIPIGIYIDNLAVIMFLMVTFVAMLIHIYSIGYMWEDSGFPRFFTFLSLFCFSMLGLVASANIFMVFVFWELVGLCSYLLIGHWYQDKVNTDAANKAFIVNRVGDVGMLVGLGVIWTSLGMFNIAEINHSLRDAEGRLYDAGVVDGQQVVELRDRETGLPLTDPFSGEPRRIPYWVLGLAGLGIFAGCVGKSAQFPLHVWLPDAMAGPTPVSALIHAATMVAAGVYLVGRFFPLFTDSVLLYIAYTGGITLFIGATIATVQTDYKKVLAYSTVSQLGFMMLGLGVRGWSAGLFHLLTHAFFKALLFLGAGSVYHSVHTYEMPVLGGLWKKMRVTAITMLVGTLAIAGFPLLSGFYSKDAILASSLYFVMNEPQHLLLFLLPAVGAVLTAFYMFRMWFLLFDGEPRGYPAPAVAEVEHEHGHHDDPHAPHTTNPAEHAHESPGIMIWPLIILAVPTVIIGWPWRMSSLWVLPIAEPVLEQMLTYGSPVRAIDLGAAHYYAMGASILIAAVGIGAAVGYYSQWRIFDPRVFAERIGGLYNFLVHKWYFDELYQAVFVRPTLALARFASEIDRLIIDGLVNGSARVTVLVSRLGGLFDLRGVDRVVNGVADLSYALGDWGRGLQTGKLRNYLMFLALGVVVLFVGLFAWIRPDTL